MGILIRGLCAVVIGVTLAGCGQSGSDGAAGGAGDGAATPEDIAHVRSALRMMRLKDTDIRLEPEAEDWTFLAEERPGLVAKSGAVIKDAAWEQRPFILSHTKVTPSGYVCRRYGPFSIQAIDPQHCIGENTAFRADSQASGAFGVLLDWTGPGRVTADVSLDWKKTLASGRIFAAQVPALGQVVFVQEGSGLTALRADGSVIWTSDGLGVGEILTVADLDGDGAPELLYSPFRRLNGASGASTSAGELLVLDARTGAVQWQYAFSGIESGLTRDRFALASFDGGRTLSLVAVQIYSGAVWRFDFDGGPKLARLRWAAPVLIDPAPGRRPLVVDVDGDGTKEVIVDAYGLVSILNADTGEVRSSAAYASGYTMGGFVTYAESGTGGGASRLVAVSDSVYLDGAAVLDVSGGDLSLRWSQVFEQGIERQDIDFSPAPRLFGIASDRHFAWSRGPSSGDAGSYVLETVSVDTGQTIDSRSGLRLRTTLRGPDGDDYLLANTSDGVAVVRDDVGHLTPVATLPNTTAVVDSSPLDLRSSANGGYPFALIAGKGGLLSGLRIGRSGPVVWSTGLIWPSAVASAHWSDDLQAYLISDGSNLFIVSVDGLARRIGRHGPTAISTPLVADFQRDGGRQALIAYGDRRALISFGRDAHRVAEYGGSIWPAQREGTLSPVILGSPGMVRTYVGFETSSSGRPTLVARKTDGAVIWNNSEIVSGWEPLLAGAALSPIASILFYHDSTTTARLDPTSGRVMWQVFSPSQCQRQMSVTDWDGDGTPDLALQTESSLSVFSGVDGAVLDRWDLRAPYGGYTATIRNANADGGRTLMTSNSGGIAAVNRPDGILLDAQLDLRLLEGLPLVVESGEAVTGDKVWQMTGAGSLRQLSAAGQLVRELEFGEPVMAASGAWIGPESSFALLITTFRGQLVAYDTTRETELWRLDLHGIGGAPVVEDIDGDGKADILVATTDGRLLVIQE